MLFVSDLFNSVQLSFLSCPVLFLFCSDSELRSVPFVRLSCLYMHDPESNSMQLGNLVENKKRYVEIAETLSGEIVMVCDLIKGGNLSETLFSLVINPYPMLRKNQVSSVCVDLTQYVKGCKSLNIRIFFWNLS